MIFNLLIKREDFINNLKYNIILNEIINVKKLRSFEKCKISIITNFTIKMKKDVKDINLYKRNSCSIFKLKRLNHL